jgi:hypothetical protein
VFSYQSELVVANLSQDAISHRKRFRRLIGIAVVVALLPVLIATALVACLILRPVNRGPVSALVGPPRAVSAFAGLGQVTVRWAAIPAAVRYQVYRADDRGGKFTLVSTF